MIAAARREGAWRTVLALALLGLLLGYLWGVADRPRYTATASLLVEPPPGGEVDGAAFERYAALGTSAEVADSAAAVLGGDVAGADLLSDIEVEPSPEAGTLLVSATSEQPDFAAAAADGFAEALAEVAALRANDSYRRAVDRLDEKLAGLDPASPEAVAAGERLTDLEAARASDPLSVGSSAALPEEPSENRSAAVTSLAGLVAGTLLGLIAVAAGAAARRRAARPAEADRDPDPPDEVQEEVAEESSEPAGVPLAEAVDGPEVASIPAPVSVVTAADGAVALAPDAAEAFERMADGLGLDAAGGPRTVAVSSAGSGDAGAVAAGLGIVAADLGMRALVVDADLAAPTLGDLLEVPESPGLADYLGGASTPRDVLRSLRARVDGGDPSPLICVPAGRDRGRRGDISAPRFESLVSRLPKVYDVVIFAAPPLTDPNGGTLPALVDAQLVIGPGEVPAERAEDLARSLRGRRPAGVVTVE